jgi:hypothetical protein
MLSVRAAGPTIHHEALDWATRASDNGGVISTTTIRAVSEFCRAVDTAGIRGRFVRLNLFAGGNLSGALVPLYRAASYGGTVVGGSTDTNANFVTGDYAETGASGGLTGNGTSKYLSCGASILSQLSVGSAHISISGVSLTSGGAADVSPIGSSTGTGGNNIAILQTKASTAAVNRVFVNGTPTAFIDAATAISSGQIIGSSVATNDLRIFQNGTQNGSTLTTSRSGTLTANAVFVFANNTNGTAASFASARMTSYSIGSGLTAAQAATFAAAIAAFNTTLGR